MKTKMPEPEIITRKGKAVSISRIDPNKYADTGYAVKDTAPEITP